MNFNKKLFFLCFFVLILSVNLSFASDTNNVSEYTCDQSTSTSTISDVSVSTTSNTKYLSQNNTVLTNKSSNSLNNQTVTRNVSINSISTTKSLKKDSNGISNYDELYNSIENLKSSNYASYTINLKEGNYNISKKITWGNTNGTLRNLSINGNNSVFYGNSNFISISNGYSLNMFNITFKNLSMNTTILNEGDFSLTNSEVNNSTFQNFLLSVNRVSSNKNVTSNVYLTNNTFANNIGNLNIILNSTLSLDNNTFLNNTNTNGLGGICIYTINSTIRVNNSEFKSNMALNSGILALNSSKINLTNSIFLNNYAKRASSLYLLDSMANLNNISFINDTSYNWGGCIGAIDSKLSISNSNFINSTSLNGEGGSIYSRNTQLELEYNKFINNKASFGGAILHVTNYLIMSNNSFINNMAKFEGGAIYSMYSYAYIINITFNNNTANNGGCIYDQYGEKLNITNTLFINNKAQIASAIYNTNTIAIVKQNVFINNNATTIYINKTDLSNFDENWWGVNNPDFNTLIPNNIPDSWIIMTFINTTPLNNPIINMTVSLNTLSNGNIYKQTLPTRIVYFNSTKGQFKNNTLPITTTVTNTYNGTYTDIYATIDNQILKISSKITPTIITNNITTTPNSTINITALMNKDATGKIAIKINGKTITTTPLYINNGFIQYTYTIPSTWKLKEHNITIVYGGNNKYQSNTLNTTLIFKSINKNSNIIITPLNKTINKTNITLPEKYDLREEGFVTPIKNQGNAETCWSFGTYGTLESNILKQLNKTYIFSENNMKNLIANYSIYGVDKDPNIDGGNKYLANSYLLSWLGTINSTEDVYDDSGIISPLLNSTIHIQNIYMIPNRLNATDNNLIKEALIKYGAVVTSYYEDGSMNPNTYGYYYAGDKTATNHLVCIVGWDDNYSKYNFKTTAPGDGAFIIKNSWGPNYAENGYFYISFYDKLLSDFEVFILNDTENYLNNYQHEYISIENITYESKDLWISNTYTSKINENIAAIGTYLLDKSNYTAYIYINNELKQIQNGTNTLQGYNTIKLNQYMPVTIKDTIKVVLKITSLESDITSIMIEYDNTKNTKKSNQSFISKNGINWNDLYDYKYATVACLKLYTIITPNITTTINNTNIKAEDTIKITTTINNTNITNAKIVYKLNGITLKDTNGTPIKVNLINNTAQINYTIPKLTTGKQYNLTTQIVTNTQKIEETNIIIIQKTQIHLSLNNITTKVKNNATIIGTILDEHNNTITGKQTIQIKINGITIKTMNITNGKINTTIKTDNLNNKKYTITIKISENNIYLPNQTNKELTITT